MTDSPRTSTRPGPARPSPSPSPPSSSPSLAPTPGEYEFSEEHKEVFASLATSVSFVGVCLMLLGLVSTLFAVGAAYGGFLAVGAALIVGAAICLPLGWWMTAAGRALSALVRTRGRDIARLMEAVVQLRRLFGFARVFVILYAMAAMAAGALFVWCNFAVDKGGRCFAGFG